MSANISPLAQTFKVSSEYSQGVFITSVDLYFSYKVAGEVEPVEVQIVETTNGYPTENIVVGSKSVKEASEIIANPTGLTPVRFKMESLVFLKPNTEYAIKVLSNSTRYKVWTAIMGKTRVDNPAVLITQQPALGSLFKSQNNSTWTPEQLQDLTFVLNRAKFNTNVIGNVRLVEAQTADRVILPPNPFKITSGETSVKVHHKNHGFAGGMFVTYSGSVDTQFNATFNVVKVVNSDYYIISAASQTDTDMVGGGNVTAEKSVKFDTIRVLGIEEGRDTGVKLTARLSSGTSIDSADIDIAAGEFTDLTTNKYVHTSVNRKILLAGANSFTLKTALSSNNDAVSPIIDTEYLQIQLISNKINSPSIADIDFAIDGDIIVTGSANISFAAATNEITVPVTTDYTKIKEGAWIVVADAGGLNNGKSGYISDIDTVANTLTIVGDALVNESGRSSVINQYTSFVSETQNNGSAESKHITKMVQLKNPCTGFRVLLDANIHSNADIELYYRTNKSSDAVKLSETNWTKHLISYKKSVNETEFIEYEYNVTDITKFDQFQFKLVFLSSNTAVSPKIKMLRVIAHA